MRPRVLVFANRVKTVRFLVKELTRAGYKVRGGTCHGERCRVHGVHGWSVPSHSMLPAGGVAARLPVAVGARGGHGGLPQRQGAGHGGDGRGGEGAAHTVGDGAGFKPARLADTGIARLIQCPSKPFLAIRSLSPSPPPSGLPYLVNYDCPSNLEQYIRRVGRTGRLSATGHAFTFLTRALARLSPAILKLLRDHK